MDIPKHIRDGAERAKQLHKEHYGDPEEKEVEEQEEELQEDSFEEEESKEQEEVKDEVKEEPVKEEKKDRTEDIEYWKHKFRTLEGKYNAEVPRYASEVRTLKQEIRDLKSQVDKKKEEPPPSKYKGEIDPEAYDEYGDDMKKLAERVSNLLHQVDSLSQENKKLKEQVGDVYKDYTKTSYNSFLDQVRSKLPAFEEQDQDPDFLQWVEDRGIDLATVGKNRDVERAVKIYKDYAKLNNPKYLPESEQPKPEVKEEPEVEEEPKPNKKVKKQVSPPRSRPSPPTENKNNWTRDQISQVYKDIQSGVYSEKEAYKLKQQIFKAQKEGNIS